MAVATDMTSLSDYLQHIVRITNMHCLTGDHTVLTSNGWSSIAQMRLGELVMSLNPDTYAMEWRPVTAVISYDVDPRDANDSLFRMQGSGMDVIATRHHRMLLAQLKSGHLDTRLPLSYETVQQLLDLTYDTADESKSSRFEHSSVRAALCAGLNRQPAVKVVISGLRRVCDWWWAQDQQLAFLTFLGVWLALGSLDAQCGAVLIPQPKEEASAWLVELLDAVFPRCWHRGLAETGRRKDGTTASSCYLIDCPPLSAWLRVMAVGPLGYNPSEPSARRRYPHFAYDPDLSAQQLRPPHRQPGKLDGWTEEDMLAAITASADARSGYCCSGAIDCRCARCWPSQRVDLNGFTSSLLEDERRPVMNSPVVVAVMAARRGAVETQVVDPPDTDAADMRERSGDVDSKRWLGDANVGAVFSRLSRRQAVALLDGFCRVDGGAVEYDQKSCAPSGCWRCSSSSIPLIDHLQLIAQLAEASVEVALHSASSDTQDIDEDQHVAFSADRWQLRLTFSRPSRCPVPMTQLGRPVDVSADVEARGYYQYEDDGRVYCIQVADNHNFLTQRLCRRRLDGGGLGVAARAVFVGNCLTPPATLQGDANFLAANLYARSMFGEDALLNVSVEKHKSGKIGGYLRIRSKTQGIALSLGDKITAKQKHNK